MFHGAGSDGGGTEATTGITGAANRYGFIAVYPNANGKYWNVSGGGPTGEDDVTFVRSLLDQLDGVLCIDDSRIYAVGGSNGGGFVARIGCELSDRLVAFASVAGLYGPQPACQPTHPLSVLEIHGTADQTVPYAGLSPKGIASVPSFLSQWEQWDSCPSKPAVWNRIGLRTLLQTKSGCAGGTTVTHVKLLGEPHAWPSAHASSGVQFGAAQAVMRFFATGSVN
jgi:polyhydroxybutyrate depolymerase